MSSAPERPPTSSDSAIPPRPAPTPPVSPNALMRVSCGVTPQTNRSTIAIRKLRAQLPFVTCAWQGTGEDRRRRSPRGGPAERHDRPCPTSLASDGRCVQVRRRHGRWRPAARRADEGPAVAARRLCMAACGGGDEHRQAIVTASDSSASSRPAKAELNSSPYRRGRSRAEDKKASSIRSTAASGVRALSTVRSSASRSARRSWAQTAASSPSLESKWR